LDVGGAYVSGLFIFVIGSLFGDVLDWLASSFHCQWFQC
jgi:hypothetical protein